jgi:hypothetical protein
VPVLSGTSRRIETILRRLRFLTIFMQAEDTLMELDDVEEFGMNGARWVSWRLKFQRHDIRPEAA